MRSGSPPSTSGLDHRRRSSSAVQPRSGVPSTLRSWEHPSTSGLRCLRCCCTQPLWAAAGATHRSIGSARAAQASSAQRAPLPGSHAWRRIRAWAAGTAVPPSCPPSARRTAASAAARPLGRSPPSSRGAPTAARATPAPACALMLADVPARVARALAGAPRDLLHTPLLLRPPRGLVAARSVRRIAVFARDMGCEPLRRGGSFPPRPRARPARVPCGPCGPRAVHVSAAVVSAAGLAAVPARAFALAFAFAATPRWVVVVVVVA